MSPKYRMVTMAWCSLTMVSTLMLSHGHLIMREILAHWPQEDSWEGRLQNALYTQGGLTVLASMFISAALIARGYFVRRGEDERSRRELAQRERHERAAMERHEALLASLANMRQANSAKKLVE